MSLKTRNRYRWDFKCCNCGKFIKAGQWEASMPFGTCYDEEPPDEEFTCLECVEKSVQYYIEAGWIPQDCNKPFWQYKVAKALGMVTAGPKGAAWTMWYEPDKLPKDYEIRWDSRIEKLPGM